MNTAEEEEQWEFNAEDTVAYGQPPVAQMEEDEHTEPEDHQCRCY